MEVLENMAACSRASSLLFSSTSTGIHQGNHSIKGEKQKKTYYPEIVIKKPSSFPRDTTGDSVKAFRTLGWKYAKHPPSSSPLPFLWLLFLLLCWLCHWGGVSERG